VYNVKLDKYDLLLELLLARLWTRAASHLSSNGHASELGWVRGRSQQASLAHSWCTSGGERVRWPGQLGVGRQLASALGEQSQKHFL